jgi:RNA polymerase sigma-70 factor (ECF subfamily)
MIFCTDSAHNAGWAMAANMGMSSPADEAVARLRRGDPSAVAAILGQYQFRLYRFLLRMVREPATAEDLFQQTWVRVMEKISTYNVRHRFDGWLFSIARNLAIDHLRRKTGFSLDAVEEGGEAPVARLQAAGADPLDQVLDFERGSMVAAAMEELPAIHREVLTLRFEEDMRLEEIAQVAGIPLSTVKSRLHRALEGLRVRVEERMGRQ